MYVIILANIRKEGGKVTPLRDSFSLIRLLLWVVMLTLAFLCGVRWGVFWLESPAGERAVSSWATAQVARQAPGSQIKVERLRLHWPPRLEASRLYWTWATGRVPILEVRQMVFSIHSGGIRKEHLWWSARGRVDRFDLDALDLLLTRGKWKASGDLTGWVGCVGIGTTVESLNVLLEAKAPGGTLGGEFLTRLLKWMPASETQAKLFQSLQSQSTFHFQVGTFQVVPEGEAHRIHLLLDGDHLLDITIRVPKDSVGVLRKPR